MERQLENIAFCDISVKTLLKIICFSVILFFIWNFISKPSYYHEHARTWFDGGEPPAELDINSYQSLRSHVCERKYVSLDNDNIGNVSYLECGIQHKRSVVFLHGAGNSANNWQNILSLQLAASIGYRAIAIDLPSHGETLLKAIDQSRFLHEFLFAVDVIRPVIVAASMGGAFALPFIMNECSIKVKDCYLRPNTCHKRISGFVSIAIVSTHLYKPRDLHQCHAPSMLIYGENDTFLGLHSVSDLRNMPNNHIFRIDKAGHGCQHDQPLMWNNLLKNFLLSI